MLLYSPQESCLCTSRHSNGLPATVSNFPKMYPFCKEKMHSRERVREKHDWGEKFESLWCDEVALSENEFMNEIVKLWLKNVLETKSASESSLENWSKSKYSKKFSVAQHIGRLLPTSQFIRITSSTDWVIWNIIYKLVTPATDPTKKQKEKVFNKKKTAPTCLFDGIKQLHHTCFVLERLKFHVTFINLFLGKL